MKDRLSSLWIRSDEFAGAFIFKLPALRTLSLHRIRVPWENLEDSRVLKLRSLSIMDAEHPSSDAVLACMKCPELENFHLQVGERNSNAIEVPTPRDVKNAVTLGEALTTSANSLKSLKLSIWDRWYFRMAFYPNLHCPLAPTDLTVQGWPCYDTMSPEFHFLANLATLEHLQIDTWLLGMFLDLKPFSMRGQLPQPLKTLHLIDQKFCDEQELYWPRQKIGFQCDLDPKEYCFLLEKFLQTFLEEQILSSQLPNLQGLTYLTYVDDSKHHTPSGRTRMWHPNERDDRGKGRFDDIVADYRKQGVRLRVIWVCPTEEQHGPRSSFGSPSSFAGKVTPLREQAWIAESTARFVHWNWMGCQRGGRMDGGGF